jgi:predicted nucleic acid-binding Zn ribbon protein
MPTYVYKFVETGETIEVQQGFQDPSLTEAAHPATGVSMPVKKVFTPVGVTFKGGGFYKTDSRGGGKPSSASPGADTTSTGTSTDTSSSTSESSTAPAAAATPAASTASKSD